MDQEYYQKKIKEIAAGMKCPDDFKCCKPGAADLCKVQYEHSEVYLECLEADWEKCKFAKPQRGKVFCQCPMRIYIFKTLKK